MADALLSDAALDEEGVSVLLEDGEPIAVGGSTITEGAHIAGGRRGGYCYVNGKRSRWGGDPEQVLAAMERHIPEVREFWLDFLTAGKSEG